MCSFLPMVVKRYRITLVFSKKKKSTCKYIYCIWKTINKVKCNFKNVLFYHLLLSMSVKLFTLGLLFYFLYRRLENLACWQEKKRVWMWNLFLCNQTRKTAGDPDCEHSTNNSVSVQLFLLNGMKRLSAGIAATYPKHFHTVFCFTIVWRQWVLHNNHSSLDILHAGFRKSVFKLTSK